MIDLKEEAKKQVKRWAFRAALPYILWGLGIVLGVLLVIGLVILVITSICSTWLGWGASKAAGVVGGDYCKAFEGFQPVFEKLENAKVQEVDYSKTPTQ